MTDHDHDENRDRSQDHDRGASDSSLFAGMPWWVRAIAIIGFPAMIATGLIWSNEARSAEQTRTIGAKADEIKVAVTAMQSEAKVHDITVSRRFEVLDRGTSETNRLLLVMCVRDAKTSADRAACLGGRQ